MPYIGNEVGNRFVASKAASVYSGDGSTTAFTLEHAVGSDEDILVSVDGVVQEPSVAYAVSSGTTLTFTAAPSSNSGNNIFVYYLFRTVATVDHPSTSALTATSGTFTGVVGIGTTSPTSNRALHISSTAQKHAKFERTGSATSQIEFSDSTTSNQPSLGSVGDNLTFETAFTERMRIDSTGAVTMPSQPAFLATASTNQNNFGVGSDVTVNFGTEVFDQNADYNGTTTFTAPVTGKYHLSTSVGLLNIDSASTYYLIKILTSNRTYLKIIDPDFGQDNAYFSMCLTVVADMDASDTAAVKVVQGSGATQTDIEGNGSYTNFSGALLC
jgi:hypothetical protein